MKLFPPREVYIKNQQLRETTFHDHDSRALGPAPREVSVNVGLQRRTEQELDDLELAPWSEEREAEHACSSARATQVAAQGAVEAAKEAAGRGAHALEASGAAVARVEARLHAAEQEMVRLQRRRARCEAEGGCSAAELSDKEDQAWLRQRAVGVEIRQGDQQAWRSAGVEGHRHEQLEQISKVELEEVRHL